ncbi:MAG: trypsin-like serine peptidase, partial [Solirubrobacterales bacterium]
MIERRGRRLAVVAALAAGGTLALAGPAAADPAGVVSQPLAQAPEETLDHWTPERVREAVAAGPPAAPGGSVDPPAGTSAIPPDAETDPALDTVYPQRVHGLLLVQIAGQGASCSATVVSSREEDVIVTAGHCLLIPGELSGGAGIVFAESVVFIPGYRNPGTGAAPTEPFGRFAGVRLGTPRAFAQIGDISFDFGVVKLAPGAAGKIETAIGSRGIAFNRKPKSFRGDTFEIYGYPARPPPEYD